MKMFEKYGSGRGGAPPPFQRGELTPSISCIIRKDQGAVCQVAEHGGTASGGNAICSGAHSLRGTMQREGNSGRNTNTNTNTKTKR